MDGKETLNYYINKIREYMKEHNGEKPEEIVITRKDFDEIADFKSTNMQIDKDEITHIYGVKIKIEE